MNAAFFAKHIGLSVEEVENLMVHDPAELYESRYFRDLVSTLDYQKLSAVMPEVRAAYDTHLPKLVETLRNEHHYTGRPMTASTLSNWVLGFLHEPSYLGKMVELHQRVPRLVMDVSLPEIMIILESIGSAGQEWKRAIALLSMPLYAGA